MYSPFKQPNLDYRNISETGARHQKKLKTMKNRTEIRKNNRKIEQIDDLIVMMIIHVIIRDLMIETRGISVNDLLNSYLRKCSLNP